ncbi:MAG: VOC family protein [Pseudomonadota bacterium]
MSISPYLFFPGACREALTAYAEILGGEIEAMMTYGDAPPDEEMPQVDPAWIMHGAIRVGTDLIMATDDAPGRNVTPASTYIMVTLPSRDAAAAAFDRLAKGGEVQMGFEKTFWSEGFGSLRDRWGQLWMISAESTS